MRSAAWAGQAPLLDAAVRTPAGLHAQVGIERDIAVRRIVDEKAVRNQDDDVALAAAVRQPIAERDPVVAAGIEIVGEIIGVRAGKSRAGREIGEAAGFLLPDLQRIQRYVLLAGLFVEIEQELAVVDALSGAVGAVAGND